MGKLAVVILAAGEGKRMKSEHSKVTFEVCQKPMIKWVYEAGMAAGADTVVIVIGHMSDEVKSCIGAGAQYVLQSEQLGTGHAVMQAIPYIKDCEDVIILCGDAPLITSDTLKQTLEFHKKEANSVTVISAKLDNPTGYGRIVRSSGGSLERIVEEKDASPEEKKIDEINSGMYCFSVEDLSEALSRLDNNNAQKEYYLTDTVSILKSKGKKVEAYLISDCREIVGVNDKVQLYEVGKIMQRRINERHALSGVVIVDFDNTYIGGDVRIGQDTIIMPNTIIGGRTVIGRNAKVGPNSQIYDCVLGDNVEFISSVAYESSIGDFTRCGPFAYLRPGSRIGRECKVGDFVEVKNSVIGDRTKASHLTYIGDADVGEGVNFGCGTVIVNYDGAKKYRSVIKDNVFIGCNSNIVSPVTINEGSYIAAGSTITENVPKNSLAIARSRQVIKEGWKDRRNSVK